MQQQQTLQIQARGGVNNSAPILEPIPDANSQPFVGQPTPGECDSVATMPFDSRYEYGMPSSINNTVRMIQPFYSDDATVEKARPFRVTFERATLGMNATFRLSAFRDFVMGKLASIGGCSPSTASWRHS